MPPFFPPITFPCPPDTFSTAITSALNLSDWLEHASMVTPLSLRDPFPQMFSPDITLLGLIHSVSREELAESGATAMVKSIPVGTSIENTSGLYSLLSSCANLFEQRTHLHLFSIQQNIERDLMEESKHSLLSLLDRYPAPVEMQSPSDSDSD